MAGISAVPRWVLVGVALGALASVGVALVFYVGSRLSPPQERAAAGTPSGDTRRREEIRSYLTAIDEPFREDHVVGDVSVPFYLPTRNVAVTFDAHDYFRLDGEGVHAVLCEHEMPGRGLGRRLPFDVTEPEWGPGPRRSRTPESVAAAFSELDLPTDADAGEVKRAYRERVKQAHPDRGGDEESFQRVQAAYATASDHADGETTRPDPGDRREASSGFGR